MSTSCADIASSVSATAAASCKVQQCWPGREKEASILRKHIYRSRGENVIFVYGRSGTGKTAVVRSTLACLNQRHAYVNAIEVCNERAILQLIVEQLRASKKRKRDVAFQSDAASILHHDFTAEIAALFPPSKVQTAWIVLDNVQRLSASVIRVLLSLSHGSAAVSWVLIGQEPVERNLPMMTGQPTDLLYRLKVLHFEPYSPADCGQVIHQWQPSDDSEARRQLQRQLMPLAMMSRNAEDMQQDVTYAAEILLGGNLTWTPTSDHQFVQSASQGVGSRRRFQQRVPQHELSDQLHIGTFATRQSLLFIPDFQDNRQPPAEALHLPVFAKALIVAAHVASRTKEAKDRTNFDPSARKRRRRTRLAHDAQTMEADLDEVRGRNTFGRERLLAIFWSLLDAHLGQQDDKNAVCISHSTITAHGQQSAETLDQVASLVASKALVQAADNGLIATKYMCDMPDTYVQHLARELNFDLRTYVD